MKQTGNKIQITKGNKIIINILLFACIYIFLVYFVIVPSMNCLEKNNKLIATDYTTWQSKDKNGDTIDIAKKNIYLAEDKISQFEKYFLANEEELVFITDIENIANQNNISAKINLSESASKKEEVFPSSPLSINASGHYQNLASFLADLETFNKLLNIKKINISSADFQAKSFENINSNRILTMELSGEIYLQ